MHHRLHKLVPGFKGSPESIVDLVPCGHAVGRSATGALAFETSISGGRDNGGTNKHWPCALIWKPVDTSWR